MRFFYNNGFNLVMKRRRFFCMLLIAISGFPNLILVNRQNIQQAVEDARAYFSSHSGQRGLQYHINLPSGRFNIVPNPGESVPVRTGLINFDNFDPGVGNKLIISGQGMYRTTLVFPVANTNVSGRNASRIQFKKLHFTKDRLKVTQGTVVSENSDPRLIVQLDAGYPTLAKFPAGIFDNAKDHGRKVRRYAMIPDPHNPGQQMPVYRRYDDNRPGGLVWKSAIKFAPNDANDRRWRITMQTPSDRAYLKQGHRVGFKSKHGGQAYQFINGANISFISVQWTHETRGIFRGVENVTVKDSRAGIDSNIDSYFKGVLLDDGSRGDITGVVPFLASSSGGPQIGSPYDHPLNWRWLGDLRDRHGVLAPGGGSDHTVENNLFFRLGDDPIGIFNVESRVKVVNNRLIDGPARGTLNYNVCGFFNHVTGLGGPSGNSNSYRNTWPKNSSNIPNDRLYTNWDQDVIDGLCAEWKRTKLFR